MTKKLILKNLTTAPTQKAFTLAEVLITLGILGVVAILTIPMIIGNYKYKAYAASTSKAYSQLSHAVQSIMEEEISNNFSQTTAGVQSDCKAGEETGACFFLRNNFKVATECGTDMENKPCDANLYQYKNFYGTSLGTMPHEHCIITQSNVGICMGFEDNTQYIYIDANGPASEPNMTGLDTYVLAIINNKLEDVSNDKTNCNNPSASTVKDAASGCLTQLYENGWSIDDSVWRNRTTSNDNS